MVQELGYRPEAVDLFEHPDVAGPVEEGTDEGRDGGCLGVERVRDGVEEVNEKL